MTRLDGVESSADIFTPTLCPTLRELKQYCRHRILCFIASVNVVVVCQNLCFSPNIEFMVVLLSYEIVLGKSGFSLEHVSVNFPHEPHPSRRRPSLSIPREKKIIFSSIVKQGHRLEDKAYKLREENYEKKGETDSEAPILNGSYIKRRISKSGPGVSLIIGISCLAQLSQGASSARFARFLQ